MSFPLYQKQKAKILAGREGRKLNNWTSILLSFSVIFPSIWNCLRYIYYHFSFIYILLGRGAVELLIKEFVVLLTFPILIY